MKHVLKFICQSFIVIFYLYPIVIGRYIWTFKWDDKVSGMRVSKLIPQCWKNMIRKINGLPTWSTY